MERLEDRSLLATFTWDGGSLANSNWTTAENWVADVAPPAGSDLVFPTGAARLNNTNSFAAGTNFNSIQLTGGGYMVDGNAISLTSGLTSTIAAGQMSDLLLPIKLVGSQTWTSTNAGSFLVVGSPGPIDLNGADLTINGAGFTSLGAFADTTNAGGANGVIMQGSATLALFSPINIPMTVTLNDGILQVLEPAPQTAVLVNGGQMITDAAASTGAITAAGGKIAPGSEIATGIQSVQGNLSLSLASSLAVELNGTTAGTGYDQTNVTGTASLGGAALNVSQSVASSTGNTFTILTATGGITGTFAGLPDLAIFNVNGRQLQIDYSINNVVITDLGPVAATSADVSALISDSPDPVAPGAQITYTVTVSNNGNAAASNVVLLGNVPDNTTFVSADYVSGALPDGLPTTPPVGGTGQISVNFSSLPSGASATFSVVVAVNSGVGGGTTIAGTATASSSSADGNLTNNSSTTTTRVAATADLQITKTPSTTTAIPGQAISYTIVVTNNGPGAVSGATVTDAIGGQLIGATFTANGTNGADGFSGGAGNINQTVDLPNNATITYIVSGTIPSSLTGTLNNTAVVTAPANVTDAAGNNSAPAAVQLTPTVDLSISKTDNVSTVSAGQSLIYTIVVSNSGPSDVVGAIVSDTFPSAFESPTFTVSGTGAASGFTAGTGNISQSLNLPAGTSVTYIVMGTVSPTATGNLINTATITAPGNVTEIGPGPNTATDNDTITTTQITADATVSKSGPASVIAGTDLTYTITVNNIGTSAATNVTLTDVVPMGTTFVSLSSPAGWVNGTLPAVGGTGTITSTIGSLSPSTPQTFTLIVKANASAANASQIQNTSTVSADADVNTDNNSSMTATTVATSADLSVTKTANTDVVLPDDLLTYTILVTNNGPSNAQDVSLTDLTPADTSFFSLTNPVDWTVTTATGISGNIPTLAAGATATFTFVVRVDSTVPAGEYITNTTTVSSTTEDPTPVNNHDTATTLVTSQGLPECDISTLNSPGNPGTATIEDDADSTEGGNVLIVTGTSGKDTIIVEPNPRDRSEVRVRRNGRTIGEFESSDFDRIVVFGLEGNDTIIINAKLSHDATLFGDEGNDQLFGARGNDQLDGGSGADRLFGFGGDDALCGDDGNDFLYGGVGSDTLFGDAGSDRLYGESGNDLLIGGDGSDYHYGGAGNDQLYGQAGNDQFFGGSGNDIAVGGDGNDKLFGSSGRDILIGGNGIDQLFGDTSDDILVSGSTVYDESQDALVALLAEWTSTNSYNTRVNNIRSGGGANGVFTLDDITVIDDGVADTLYGDGSPDWFLVGSRDRIRDLARDEQVN